MLELSRNPQIVAVITAVEAVRLARRQQVAAHPHPQGKRFSQEELAEAAYPSYKNLINGRTGRLPDRTTLMQIADYLECTLDERNSLLLAAQYAVEKPTAAQQRKQLTILVARLAQLDQLAETLDVEDLYRVTAAFWQRLDRVVLDYGGMVDKHGDDTVTALWGAAHTREDEAERAVRAALALQRTLSMLNQDYEINLMLRIGINTGMAFVGAVGTLGEFTAIGQSVNTARHLQANAAPNSILIADNTFRHVRAVFETHRVTVVDQSVQDGERARFLQGYLVDGLRPRAFRHSTRDVEQVATPLIGRAGELERLQITFRETSTRSQLHMLTMIGDNGIGKSRLLYEFDDWLNLIPEGVYYFKGRASPSTQAVVNALLRDVIAFRFEIMDSDMAVVVRRKLEHNCAEVLGESGETRIKAHLIGYYLGLDFGESDVVAALHADAASLQKRVIAALQEYFGALADRYPVVVLLEDLHWADEGSVRVLQQVWAALADRAVLIVGTARPPLLERFPEWGRQPYHQRLPLAPLSEASSRALLEHLLPNAPDLWARLIPITVERAEGNPFYLEELVKMLIDDGVIVPVGEGWQLNAALPFPPPIPSTLTSVLQARFDNLPTREKQTLQCASVIGRVFWDDSIAALQVDVALSARSVQRQVMAALESLSARELIVKQKLSTLEHAEEYLFRHALLREGVYGSILKEQRREYHHRAAEWMIRLSEKRHRSDEYAALIADHLEHADMLQAAAGWYARAGTHAAMRYLNDDAVRLLTRALDKLPDTPDTQPTRGEWLIQRIGLYVHTGDKLARAADLRTLLQIAQMLSDPALYARTLLLWAHYHEDMGNHAEAISTAQQAVPYAREANLLEVEVESYLVHASSYYFQGNPQYSRDLCLQALRLAKSLKNRLLEARVYTELCKYEKSLNDLEAAERHIKQAQALFRLFRDPVGEGQTYIEIGQIAFLRGMAVAAEKALTHALDLHRAVGYSAGLVQIFNTLGNIATERLDFLAARDYITQSYQLAMETGQENGALTAFLNTAFVSWPIGDMDFAMERLQQSLQKAEQVNNQRIIGYALHGTAKVLRERGQPQEAVDYAAQAADCANQIQFPYLEAYALAELGYGLIELRRYDDAWNVWLQTRALTAQDDPEDHFNAEIHLALVASLRNDASALAEYSQRVRAYIDQHEIASIRTHVELYASAYRLFRLLNDSRAVEFLRVGYRQMEQTARLLPDDAARARMIANVTTCRRLVELWNGAGETPSPYLTF